jgi:hypothetical protein
MTMTKDTLILSWKDNSKDIAHLSFKELVSTNNLSMKTDP